MVDRHEGARATSQYMAHTSASGSVECSGNGGGGLKASRPST
jgi:hypothetical protein